MMSTAQIKQQLHDYIESANDKKLKAIYTLIENDLTYTSRLTDAQKELLDKRYNDYQNELGQIYTWDETVAIGRAAVKEHKNIGCSHIFISRDPNKNSVKGFLKTLSVTLFNDFYS